jgi:hypothetical protein
MKKVFYSMIILVAIIISPIHAIDMPDSSSLERFASTTFAISTAIAFWTMRDQQNKLFILGVQDRNKLFASSMGCLIARAALSDLIPKSKHLNWMNPVLQSLLTGYGALGIKKVFEDEDPYRQERNRPRRYFGIDYNNIRLWQVLGIGTLINKYVDQLQGKQSSPNGDLILTNLWWWLLNI